MEIKATALIMSLCDEMFERKAGYGGRNWPPHWKKKTREKLVAAGLVESKGHEPKVGEVYYFTEVGLSWYLGLRPERKR
ncbi:TPA: hypothetical protein MYQ36_003056 [Citrobacter braakii]|jgi:hypothetical protein|uniref:Uncharacterized protein n=1 Tax=Escherichia coli TaxID=562 RepID=A0A8T3UQB6_ECOLX|nr:hypothetical protein [Salmonella enterica]EAU5126033.1 hypothetical protein [Salmonella enterica subsp. enterica serovar Infantis]EBZ7083044.1 hypothetical protein [Salmonella enterica subsp. enterica serovar Montevideo]ECK2477075.1 hypothetical protein [Salmonella enterica subsp. enterica serovar Cerro]ELH0844410.1 hypothetical protein [Vibrio cholerae]MBB2466225.1 hypothetical protein [Escherichia coli]HCB1917098.1 hypothetical protein [Citrobacter braakii]HDW2136919.1 hypothetical prot